MGMMIAGLLQFCNQNRFSQRKGHTNKQFFKQEHPAKRHQINTGSETGGVVVGQRRQ